MTHRKIVVALGGNAILTSDPSAKAQKAALVQTAKHLVKLIKNGYDLIITHGNGPQVGQGDELLAILCHLDVVPAGDLSNWETLPFEATIKNDHLVGRGVQDDKGPSMAALFAVKALMAVYQEKTGGTLSQPISSGGATFARTMKNCVAFGACFPDTEQTEHQENERMPLKDLDKRWISTQKQSIA